MSHWSEAFSTMALIRSKSSGTMGYTTGSAPHWRTIAEKMEPLNSRMSPGLGSVQGGMISSPVGMIPTTGSADHPQLQNATGDHGTDGRRRDRHMPGQNHFSGAHILPDLADMLPRCSSGMDGNGAILIFIN